MLNLEDDHPFNMELANVIRDLWETPKIQLMYERRSEIQLLDSAKW